MAEGSGVIVGSIFSAYTLCAPIIEHRSIRNVYIGTQPLYTHRACMGTTLNCIWR